MIDPYKVIRVQRLVPERETIVVWARQFGKTEFRRQMMKHLAAKVLAHYAAEEALVSGAMPTEFSPSELRTEAQYPFTVVGKNILLSRKHK